MEKIKCPACGSETAADAACQRCGKATVNGSARGIRRDPPPPPALAGLVFERPTPEMIEEARRTFDMEEYLVGVCEIERTGGVQIDDLIAELERRVNGDT